MLYSPSDPNQKSFGIPTTNLAHLILTSALHLLDDFSFENNLGSLGVFHFLNFI